MKQVQREPIDAEAVPAAEALLNAAGGTRTEQAIAQAFEEAGYQLDTQTIQQIQAVFRAAAELPTEYFEAKPERAVGFDEVLAAVVPNDSSRALLVGLEQAGVQTLKYRAGDDADRLEKVNSVESARFSMKSGQGSDQILQKMLESIDEIIVLEDAGEITPDQARERAEIATHTAMESLSKLHGRIQPGERPARDLVVPRKSADNKKVSQTVRTVLEAEATPDELVPDIEQLVAEGAFSYEAYGDEQAIQDAENKILEVGYETALTDWTRDVRSGNASKFNTALGWRLYDEAANRQDMKTAMTVLTNLIEHQRNAAQAVQATRILKQMHLLHSYMACSAAFRIFKMRSTADMAPRRDQS